VKTTGADTTTIDFVEPMYALAVQNIPDGKEWLYEVKFDALVQRERIALAESPPMGFSRQMQASKHSPFFLT
jgi:hypothetical protein